MLQVEGKMSIFKKVFGLILCLSFLSVCVSWAEEPPAPPKVMGLQFGMSSADVQTAFAINLSKKLDEKDNMVAYSGSLLQIDRPKATYI
jgi:hypothetical protein